MQKTKWILVLGFLISVLSIPIFSCPALAVDYYVDVNTGDDANAGTSWPAAFKTINQAKSISQPGDHIRVNHGVYKEEITNPPSGTEGAPIIYEGIGNVVIDGEGLRNYGFYLYYYQSDPGQYITIKNFHITRTRNCAIYGRKGTKITIDNCRITNCGHLDQNWAVVFDFLYNPAYSITFTNNVLDSNYHGLYLRYGKNCEIDKNTIVNTLADGLAYSNDGADNRRNIISNNLICNSGGNGIVLSNFNGNSDHVLKNNVWNNSAPNWRVDGVTSDTWGDNLNIDPLFVSGTWFLSPDSPLIAVGTVDNAVGRRKTIGALAVGEVSSGIIDSWSGWVDENGSAVSASSLVELDADGNIQPKVGVTQAGLYSPVLSCPDSAHLRGIRVDALEALGVPAGEKQRIDADNTTITPEIRYRYSDTSFSQTAAAPAWISTNPNQPLDVKGKYFQIELVMRIDGI